MKIIDNSQENIVTIQELSVGDVAVFIGELGEKLFLAKIHVHDGNEWQDRILNLVSMWCDRVDVYDGLVGHKCNAEVNLF